MKVIYTLQMARKLTPTEASTIRAALNAAKTKWAWNYSTELCIIRVVFNSDDAFHWFKEWLLLVTNTKWVEVNFEPVYPMLTIITKKGRI